MIDWQVEKMFGECKTVNAADTHGSDLENYAGYAGIQPWLYRRLVSSFL
jgi:hypothetical protein